MKKAIDQHVQLTKSVILVFQYGDEICWQPRFHPLQRHRELPDHRSRPLWMVSPNSSNVPCKGINLRGSELHQSCLRERCRTSTDCCSSVLTAISLPGCCTAIQIARAFITLFLLPMTNALTKWAGNNRTLCPCFVNSRAQC